MLVFNGCLRRQVLTGLFVGRSVPDELSKTMPSTGKRLEYPGLLRSISHVRCWSKDCERPKIEGQHLREIQESFGGDLDLLMKRVKNC